MSVKIDFVTEYDGRALGKANKDINALSSTISSAKKTFVSLFAADQLWKFTKDSVNAYARQEKAIAGLNSSLTSLGLGFAAATSARFIHDLSLQTGVVSEQLIPAYQKLIQTTGSVNQSQQILRASIAAAAGGLVTADEAASALSDAYLGNRKSLKQLQLGLTNAQLQTMSFEGILSKVNETYANALITQTDTFANKIDKLSIASMNAKEAFGQGILNVFAQAAGNGNIDTATSKIERFGQVMGALFETAFTPAKAGKYYLPFPALSKFNQNLAKYTDYQIPAGQTSSHNTYAAQQKIQDDIKKRKAAEALAALQKTSNALATKNLKLQKAAAVFDMKKIQITAALKSARDEETVTRLKLMLAIENEQADTAEKLQKKLDEIIAKNKTLQSDLDNLKSGLGSIPSVDPFGNALTSLNGIIATIPTMANLIKGFEYTGQVWGTNAPQGIASGSYLSPNNLNPTPNAPTSISTGTYLNPTPTTTPSTPPSVNITVNGAVDPNQTAKQIADLLAQSAANSGSYSNLGFSWLQALGQTP